MSEGLKISVQRAVSRSFDRFAESMDRYVLEDYTTNEAVTAELHRQGFIDFADMWESYLAERDD